MATTAQDVFDMAMGLMDEVNESTGQTDTSDTREYKQRVLLILAVIRGEVYPYSDTFEQVQKGKRPVCAPITDFDSPIDIDDDLCQTVLPNGLAGHLLLDENPASASVFMQRYLALLAEKAKQRSAEAEPITDVYGGIGYREFSRW